MLIVGERINTSRKRIREAVGERDEAFLVTEARMQVESGANFVDVNVGTFIDREEELLPWLVETIQAKVDAPLCLDTTNARALKLALKVHRGRAMVNSIYLDEGLLKGFLPLIAEYGAAVVCLCMGADGPPVNADGRLGIAEKLARLLGETGLPGDQVYVDPLIQPVATEPLAPSIALETLRRVKVELPGLKTICGISNVSYGLPVRSLVNRSYLTMMMASGLDAALLDPLDRKLMAAVLASETLLGKDSFCRNYLRAFKAGRLG